jgi:hypothetical protein
MAGAKEAVEALTTAFRRDPLELARAEGAKALGEIGPEARSAVKALEMAKISDPSLRIREEAEKAQEKVRKED